MGERVKRLTEFLLIAYLLAGFWLAIFDFPQGSYMLAMMFGFAIGVSFGYEYHDSKWKAKYIERFEAEAEKK